MTSEPTIVVAQVTAPAEIRAVQQLFREYTDWAFTLTAGLDEAPPTFEGFEAELASLPGVFSPPAGRLLLATVDGRAAGCIALKPHHGDAAELKRLYVSPSSRGLALGERLVATLVAEARAAGYRRIVLDSHMSMTRAHDLYRAAGFHTVPVPEDFPASLKPIVVFMELDLTVR
jgi:ribosomal protein S18 acetylase RimI-like enzyme